MTHIKKTQPLNLNVRTHIFFASVNYNLIYVLICMRYALFTGDEQLAIDILANNVIFQNLKASGRFQLYHLYPLRYDENSISIQERWRLHLRRKLPQKVLANRLYSSLCHTCIFAAVRYVMCYFIDPMGGKGYSVAFDPLDGSSIIDTNFAVGTIWGIWPGDRSVSVCKLTGVSS